MQLFNDNLSEIYPDTYLIKQEKNIIFKCKIYLKECNPYNIIDTDFAKLLEGELEKNNFKYQFIGNNLDLENINLKSNYTSKKFLDTNIFHEDGIKIEIDEEKNMIIINQEEMGARAFIIDGKLQNTEIIFNGVELKMKKF